MKNKNLRIIVSCLLVILICLGTLTISASSGNDLIEEIINYKADSSVQNWIDTELTQNAGTSSEWYIIGLSQYGNYDFSSYEKALISYLNANKVYSASSRQKYALALIACGSNNEYIKEVLNSSIGEQGVMSWIYGLHLLNNGYKSDSYTLSDVKNKLLSLQLSDGGYAVTGSKGDIDATAMAVQAFAPYYKTDSKVQNAVDRALKLLSDSQLNGGDYTSYGVPNPESTAQVLVALSSLGIDAKTDERFIKNGNTLFNGIEKYLLQSGGYCHKEGGTANETATSQVFYSAVSYIRMTQGDTPLYILDKRNPEALNRDTVAEKTEDKNQSPSISKPTQAVVDETEESTTTSDTKTSEATTSDTDDESSSAKNLQSDSTEAPSSPLSSTAKATEDESGTINTSNTNSYKPIATVVIILLCIIACGILLLCRKKNKSNFILILCIGAAAICFVWLTNFSSTEDHYSASTDSGKEYTGTATISIRCDSIKDKNGMEHIPDDRTILKDTKVKITEGDTVYDVLLKATTEHRILVESNGGGDSVYIEGIANIYEFDFGELSGWIYRVNGEDGSVSCGEYTLTDGDYIEWLYTCNMGEDIE